VKEREPAHSPELPGEVLDRLSLRGVARLVVDGAPGARGDVPVAPLDRQLFLLVPRGGALERALLDAPEASLHAEDPDGEWSVRTRGRAVPGRPVIREARRSELLHWLPAGTANDALVAVRFYPEHVEYVQGKGTDRARAVGPVPGGAPPPPLTRWTLLATDGVVGWFFGFAVIDWLGLLFLVDEGRRGLVLLLLLLLVGALLLGGVTLVGQALRFDRWREGLEPDAGVTLVSRGWVPPAHLRRAGAGMIGLGLSVALLLSASTGWKLGALAVISSGAPLAGLFLAARHILRREDASEKG
jgi:hypothetical protein